MAVSFAALDCSEAYL